MGFYSGRVISFLNLRTDWGRHFSDLSVDGYCLKLYSSIFKATKYRESDNGWDRAGMEPW